MTSGTDGAFEERWWNPTNSPVLDHNGVVEAILHNANDVTAAYRAADQRSGPSDTTACGVRNSIRPAN